MIFLVDCIIYFHASGIIEHMTESSPVTHEQCRNKFCFKGFGQVRHKPACSTSEATQKGHMTLWAIYAQFSKDQNSALKQLLLY